MTDVTPADCSFLERAIELAAEADAAGDHPFGSLLVDADGNILAEDRNRAVSVDPTRHPEIALARWAAHHLDEAARRSATLYTSTEHCPMCAAAHGWVGLGRIVYASSAEQLATWLAEAGADPAPVRALPIGEVLHGTSVAGPWADAAERLRRLHQDNYRRRED
ncbi:tRNA-specific adenosine deaminase [Sphingomonas spermidinifaciens]|uniref:tRNA-specific adenosine deaminase n=1 Tax=Sphingomonas spermidinifaciens TaxID=1141889 RepID=A0A2A4B7I4_9SPHN|nr:nucleoside deaminase [Sphingomonas spermidinifaciens]PCD04040.1 tRNA-specific adenosine deaminase [Sphingomonas spermidinifaciens]